MVLSALQAWGRWWSGAAICGLVFPLIAVAAERDATSDICVSAAHFAARKTGVPVDVLLAISLTETGRAQDGRVRPWPWTVNIQGKGTWFETAQEALDYARRHRKAGARSFDMGCFQLNFRWHGAGFGSLDHMLDPEAGALYAARFLAGLYRETGSWSAAAGAYHSRTPKFATRYRKRFDRFLAGLSREDTRTSASARRVGGPQPLFRGAGAPARGSLVPVAPAGMPLIARIQGHE
ncbi:hypothetical protein C8N32_10983 [Rhodovulum imhoffii]|uniref:Transglycosylase-like protein with SLT domain n=1 Tax=Rhodovulum imhoffii TaxID=365340 RepID=A0A2T5BRP4_9RHOB|nr:hypothetical protein [Rhodovulum imhoffii]MBK5934074.1 hypothetical protein [Rhodovulum imhoffii]PTN01959.1 hypothetical protein C8N32_10983 [Rhodovulum imhoffii]